MGFIDEHFIEPLWDHSGYNAVNTSVYVIIALVSAYVLYNWLRSLGYKFDKQFISSVLPFVFFGSTARVVTDSIDTGLMQAYAASNSGNFVGQLYSFILSTHIYDYGYLTVTPGIYIVTAAFTLASLFFVGHVGKRKDLVGWVGWLLFLPNFILLMPMFTYYSYAALVFVLVAVAFAVSYFVLRHWKVSVPYAWLVPTAHALDGASTFVVINVFSKYEGKNYFEQHVLSRAIGEIGGADYGYLVFFAVKVVFALAAVYVLDQERVDEGELKKKVGAKEFPKALEREKLSKADMVGFIALLLIIFGLAPGIRDILRLITGA